jgi:pimeloyl-ACP methyl ester carboxylesterase
MTTLLTSARLRWAVPAVLLTTLLAGCNNGDDGKTAAATPPPAPAPATSAPAASAPALKGFYEQKLDWKPCADDKATKGDEAKLDCATLKVPVDYAKPDAKSIDVAAYRYKTTGDKPAGLGAIAVDPGGPGSPVRGLVLSTGATNKELTARYDIVGIDPRGTGATGGLDCVDDKELETLHEVAPSPGDAAEVGQAAGFLKKFGDGCAQRTGGELLAHLGTVDVAADLDVFRAALGQEKLNYLGYSYGTYLGAIYIEKFPDRTGRFVLDGALDPAKNRYDNAKQQAQGFDNSFRAFLKDCLAGAQCPYDGTVDEAVAAVRAKLDALDKKPLTGRDGRKVTPGVVGYTLSYSLYNSKSWPDVRGFLAAWEKGEADLMLNIYDFRTGRAKDGTFPANTDEGYTAINCADGRMVTAAEADRLTAEIDKTAPVMGSSVVWSWAADCRPPTGDLAHTLNAPTAPPVVVVGTTGDPATPYADAQALAKQLPGSALVTFEGEQHTVYNGNGNLCVKNAVNGYLLDGKLPAADTRCKA